MVTNVMLTLCFLAGVMLVYYMLPKRVRWVCLLAASLWFYMSADPQMVLLIGSSTVWTWFAGLQMKPTGTTEQESLSKTTTQNVKQKKRGWLLGGSLPLVGVLLVFKYQNFFVNSVGMVLERLGLGADERTLQLVMPLGISYYTFKLLSYLFDVYKEKIPAEKHPGYFALYTSFFPQILSGPIERADSLLPQFREPVFQRELMDQGIQRIVLGLFKKMVIANRLSAYVNTIFAEPGAYPALACWMALFFYGIQLYCDFSGYSDIAIGMSDCLGIRCKENFRMPYFSAGIKEFWNRWHISLSSWLRDYVYIPLGGSRVSPVRKNINLLVTFLVSGVWHGNNWSFVIWGAIHGVWNMFGKKERPSGVVDRIWKTLVTFWGVTFTWIFFRAESLAGACQYLKAMVTGVALSYDAILASVLPFSGDNTCAALLITVCLCIGLLFVYEWQQVYGTAKKRVLTPVWLVIFGVLTALLGVFGDSGFLYANF